MRASPSVQMAEVRGGLLLTVVRQGTAAGSYFTTADEGATRPVSRAH